MSIPPPEGNSITAEAHKIENLSKLALNGDKAASKALSDEVYGNLKNWSKADRDALQTQLHADNPATSSLPYMTFSNDANGNLTGLCIDNGKNNEQFTNTSTKCVDSGVQTDNDRVLARVAEHMREGRADSDKSGAKKVDDQTPTPPVRHSNIS